MKAKEKKHNTYVNLKIGMVKFCLVKKNGYLKVKSQHNLFLNINLKDINKLKNIYNEKYDLYLSVYLSFNIN